MRVAQALTEVPGVGLRIVQPKTARSARTLPLSPTVMAGLRRHAAKQAKRAMKLGSAYDRASDLVFASWEGGPVSARNLRRAYLAACTAANIAGARGPYDLRHTAATLLIEAGVPIKAVSDRLGHASASMTLNVYVHSTPAQQDRAVAVLGALIELTSHNARTIRSIWRARARTDRLEIPKRIREVPAPRQRSSVGRAADS